MDGFTAVSKKENAMPRPDDPASNRQKKLLKFFGHDVTDLGFENASDLIEEQLAVAGSEERWVRYLTVTGDFGREDDLVRPHTEEQLASVTPFDEDAVRDRIDASTIDLAKRLAAKNGILDVPAPDVVFEGKSFMFTGRFEFGSRKRCEDATRERGADPGAGKEVSMLTDYLVVGAKGNRNYAHGKFGTKTADALLLRLQFGHPAIISEQHWAEALEAH